MKTQIKPGSEAVDEDGMREGRSIRAGWTAPAVVFGVVAVAVGWWLHDSVQTQRSACGIVALVAALSDSHVTTSCSTVRTKETASIVLIGVGLAALVVGSLVASRRGLRAARQGRPWPVRRLLTRVAQALDARLPGHAEGRSRIKPEWLAAFLFVVIVLAVVGTGQAWQAYSKEVRRHQHAAAQRALAGLRLPTTMTLTAKSDTCAPSTDVVCASSQQDSQALEGELEALLHGKPDSTVCDLLPAAPGGVPCPVSIKGSIGGYPAIGLVFRHLLLIRSGNPPAGAIPVKPGSKYLFYRGSDVVIELAAPLDA